MMMWIVFSSGVSSKTTESLSVGSSSVESSLFRTIDLCLSTETTGMVTRQRARLSASMSLKALGFSALIAFLSSPTVLVYSMGTGKVLEVLDLDCPSTRQKRVRSVSVMVLEA